MTDLPTSILAGHAWGTLDMLNPVPGDFTLEIVAEALSNKCRWTGLIPFYSDAEHCVRVSWISDGFELEGLLHELDEIYLPDIMTPLKDRFPAWWHEMAARHMAAGCQAFGIDSMADGLPPVVQYADEVLKVTEMKSFDIKWPQGVPFPKAPALTSVIRPWTARFAKVMFLKRYKELTEGGE